MFISWPFRLTFRELNFEDFMILDTQILLLAIRIRKKKNPPFRYKTVTKFSKVQTFIAQYPYFSDQIRFGAFDVAN